MNHYLLDAFLDEFTKVAELTDRERASYKDAVRRHAKFDQQAASKRMSPADEEALRHSVERLKHFSSKKKDNNYKIPGWVHDPAGKPPAGERVHWRPAPKPGRGGGKPGAVPLESKLHLGVLGGAMAGSVGGSILRDHLNKKHKRKGTKAGRLENAMTSLGAPLAGGALGGAAAYALHRL